MFIRTVRKEKLFHCGFSIRDWGLGFRAVWYTHIRAILVQVGPFWAELSNFETNYIEGIDNE